MKHTHTSRERAMKTRYNERQETKEKAKKTVGSHFESFLCYITDESEPGEKQRK